MVAKRAPISCCMIVRDEAPRLRACLESIRPYVEELVIVDTGSKDETPDIAMEFADIFEVFTECNNADGFIEDFSMARQRSFDLATKDWALWIDGDDQVSGAEHLAEIVEVVSKKGHTAVAVAFPYDYDPSCQQYRERLVWPRAQFVWKAPIHESLASRIPDPRATVPMVDDRVKILHRRTGKVPSEPNRNLRILEKLYEKEGESDARTLFYLARELSYNTTHIDRAIKLFERYVDLSGWDDERCLACMRLSELYLQKGDHDAAALWGLKAITTNEQWGEPYFAVARAFSARAHVSQNQRDWERCVHFAVTGLNKPPTRTVLFVNPYERSVDIHRYLNFALNKLGDVQGALGSVKKAIANAPEDTNLQLNLRAYENHLARQQFRSAVETLYEHDGISKRMAETAIAVLEGRAESVTQEEIDTGAAPALGQSTSAIGPYRRPAGYPRNVTDADFPVAAILPHPQAWGIPDRTILDDLPLRMTDGQLLAMTLAVWKEYVLHDEMLSAESFLASAPYRVRHSVGVEMALRWTRATMAWMDDAELEQKTNAPADPDVECGVALPGPLTGQLLGRSLLVTDRLGAPGTEHVLDFGCSDGSIANRWALAGYDVTGVDLCKTSVALAKRKAEEFKTGARFICSKFSSLAVSDEAVGILPRYDTDAPVDVVTTTDTYEHVKDGVDDIIAPARQMLSGNPKGRMILVTPYGAWMRGAFLPWAHPWRWADEHGIPWNGPEKRAHLVAPTPWSVAKDFQDDGWWVKDSFAVMCDVQDTPGQGNVVCEAHLRAPWDDGAPGLVGDPIDPSLDVVFSTGTSWEEWTPEIARKRGVGGSETAVIEMAKRLAARGHCVRVYGSVSEHGEGIYDGVEYRQSQKVVLEENPDVLVAWRDTSLLQTAAKLKLLWAHDVYAVGPQKHLIQADKILALSSWHKSNLVNHHGVSPDQIHVTRNGIDLARFECPGCMGKSPGCSCVARDPHKVIYSSSPDRGLLSLLQMWPRIRATFADATLHVFYGWDVWKKIDPAGAAALEALALSLAPQGVTLRGKVDQKTLAREMLSAGVWAYPTWFSETSCITAMEAQAAGLRIVTSPIAALPETCGDLALYVPGDWLSADYQDRFIQHVTNYMWTPEYTDREARQKRAQEMFSWDGVVDQWEALFRTEVERKKTQPLVPYAPARTFVREGRVTP